MPIRRELTVQFPADSIVDGLMCFIGERHVYTSTFFRRYYIGAGGTMELDIEAIFNIVGSTALLVLYNSDEPVRRGWQGEVG